MRDFDLDLDLCFHGNLFLDFDPDSDLDLDPFVLPDLGFFQNLCDLDSFLGFDLFLSDSFRFVLDFDLFLLLDLSFFINLCGFLGLLLDFDLFSRFVPDFDPLRSHFSLLVLDPDPVLVPDFDLLLSLGLDHLFHDRLHDELLSERDPSFDLPLDLLLECFCLEDRDLLFDRDLLLDCLRLEERDLLFDRDLVSCDTGLGAPLSVIGVTCCGALDDGPVGVSGV